MILHSFYSSTRYLLIFFFFFFNDTATTEIYTLSLHDALPICMAGRIPLLGVCLGHQAIGQAFGGRVVRAKQVMHGKVSQIRHDSRGVFSNLPAEFMATRYHSLVVERASLPACLAVTAESEDGEIMGLRH